MTAVRGFSLIELLIVVGLMALAAVMTVTDGGVRERATLRQAQQSVEDALRWARDASLRTDTAHGIELKSTPAGLRVYRIDPLDGSARFDVRHPVTRALWALPLNTQPATDIDLLFSASWSGACTAPERLLFRSGTPTCHSSGTLLASASVTLSHAGQTETVTVDGITGRVQ